MMNPTLVGKEGPASNMLNLHDLLRLLTIVVSSQTNGEFWVTVEAMQDFGNLDKNELYIEQSFDTNNFRLSTRRRKVM